MHVKDVADKSNRVQDTQKQSSTASKETSRVDRVLIHGRTQDGRGFKVLRQRDDRLEAGIAQPLRDGEPLQGEVVKLKPHKDFPMLCDVETILPTKEIRQQVQAQADLPMPSKGPAKVTTHAYRKNWTTIWGGGVKRNTILN